MSHPRIRRRWLSLDRGHVIDSQPTGLIGVGLLGSAIAARLIASGVQVCGYDSRKAARTMLLECGGIAVDDPCEIVQRCQTIILSLPTSEVVQRLVQPLRSEFRSGQIVIDTTTGQPSQMIAIGRFLAELGVGYVEATVAGSSDQVRDGASVLFVAGDDQSTLQAKAVLDALTERHFHLGPVGSASRFKLIHNLLLGLHRAVLAEGLTFAQSLGFDLADTLAILRQTPAASAVMETKGAKMVGSEYSPQARLSQHLKDVRLIVAEAGQSGAPVPLSEIHEKLLLRAEALGFGDSDNSAVIEAYRHDARADGAG